MTYVCDPALERIKQDRTGQIGLYSKFKASPSMGKRKGERESERGSLLQPRTGSQRSIRREEDLGCGTQNSAGVSPSKNHSFYSLNY